MDADFLILCGGLGTRLRSVTGETPKVMASVQGEPFLDFLIRYLIKQGAARIILCAGYKAEAFEAYYKEKFKNIELHLSIEREPLGTGGALKNAAPLVKKPYVFGLNGDCFTPVNYQELLRGHQAKNALATLVGVRIEGNKDFGTILTNDKEEITAFKEKFVTKDVQYISAGVYCFNKSVFDMMPPTKFSIEYDFFPKLIGNRFFCHKVDAPFIDIGTPERFEWAKKHLNEMIE
ncbi:MAG: nucleotidyltransferase family protein [Candidatus Omnitrophica bacterium]|nr:nucleotidyltransferase family protein [Candidatus Omnitrophota bacterium]